MNCNLKSVSVTLNNDQITSCAADMVPLITGLTKKVIPLMVVNQFIQNGIYENVSEVGGIEVASNTFRFSKNPVRPNKGSNVMMNCYCNEIDTDQYDFSLDIWVINTQDGGNWRGGHKDNKLKVTLFYMEVDELT